MNLGNSLIDEETIKNVLSYFSLMEIFSVDRCWGFRRVEICGHDKLKKMMFRYEHDELEKFSIEIISLEYLEIDIVDEEENGMVCQVNVSSACQNLKRLSFSGIPISGRWVQKIISSLDLLEYLLLSGCYVKGEVLKLSSTVLKGLQLRYSDNLFEAEFDTPNLHTFGFVGCYTPHLALNSVASFRTATLLIDEEDYINNSWFMRLSNFIRCGRFQELSVHIHSFDEAPLITFDAKKLTGIQFPPPFELESLKLTVFTRSVNCDALLDGLLTTLHPKILSLRVGMPSNLPPQFLWLKKSYFTTDNVQLLLKRLVSERSDTCPENLIKWCESLKDITFIGLKGDHFDFPLNSRALKLLKFIALKHDNQLDSSMSLSLISYLDDLVMQAASVRNVEWLYCKLSWYI